MKKESILVLAFLLYTSYTYNTKDTLDEDLDIAALEQALEKDCEELHIKIPAERNKSKTISAPEKEIFFEDQEELPEPSPEEGDEEAMPAPAPHSVYKRPASITPATLPLSYDRAAALLKELYPDTHVGFLIPQEESDLIYKSGGNPTYGEITSDALKTLLPILNLDAKDIVYSLGSGTGKEVLFIALTTPARAIGVELSETRHHVAQKTKQKLQDVYHIPLKRHATFINKNIADLHASHLRRATIIFISNLCFSENFMHQLIKKFETLKEGTVIITMGKRLPDRDIYRLVKTLNLPMTWSSSTPVYIYQIQKKVLAKRNFTERRVII